VPKEDERKEDRLGRRASKGTGSIPDGPGTERSPRDRILDAAGDLFLFEGIPGSGVDALIERAGVAKATFYRHFSSKDDLIVAWLRSSDARWLDATVGMLESRKAAPLQRLIEFWAIVGQWERRHAYPGCPFLNTLVDIRDPQHPALQEVHSFVGEVEGFFTHNARAAGIPDPEVVGYRLRMIAMGMFMAFALERAEGPEARARADAIYLLASATGTTVQELEDRLDAERSERDTGNRSRGAPETP
jgi:AcrR family transcriptional regulator